MRKNPLLLALLISACASANVRPSDAPLQPYQTATSAPSSTPDVFVIFETPLPTSTPFLYIVQAGDTISEIAEKFKISQEELRAANPDVSPNSMSIGMTLIIPDPSSATTSASTPTPMPVPITQTVCHPTADGGLGCFALIQNNSPALLENISAQINLFDENNNMLASQTAFPPLDILPSNTSLPVYVFFPDSPATVHAQVQLMSAIQSDSSRYLPATLNNTTAQISWDGKSAQLSGQVYLSAASQAAARVWVAAVAYDKNGTVVGVKRWEGGAIQPGASIAFSFSVASLGVAIEAVEFVVQANP